MNKKQYTFLVALIICALSVIAWAQGLASIGDISTCAEDNVLVYKAASKGIKCGVGATLVYRAKGLNVNQTNTDIGTFAGLPSAYIVRRFTVNNCSATPTLSTVSLRTATSGGGTAIVNAAALSTLSAVSTFLDTTLAVTTASQSASSLTIRSVAAAGGASTCDFTLELTPLL